MLPQPKFEVALSAGVGGISADTFSRLLRTNDWPARAEQARYNVETLAKNCAVSVRQLQRFFKAHFRQSPKQRLRVLRLNRALELLRQGFCVKEVAGMLHYHDLFHFSNRFARAFGFPPSALPALPNHDAEISFPV